MQYHYWYPLLCTVLTALPEGSLECRKELSQASASGVLQATDLTDGTQEAAESDGNSSLKMERYRYSSFDMGGCMGKRMAAFLSCSSLICCSAVAFRVSIHVYPTPSENCSFCRHIMVSGK